MRSIGRNHRLRTKFLLSLVSTTAALSCATLLIVRHSVERHVQQATIEETRNSLMTFQVLIRQRQIALSRKADLMATLGALSDGDPEEFVDSTVDPLRTEGTDLVALAQPDGTITAFHTTNPSLGIGLAEQLLHASLAQHRLEDWWVAGGSIYQVALQPIDKAPTDKESRGLAIVGQEVGYRSVRDLGRISSSEVAFSYGNEVVISTLAPLDEQELGRKLKDWTRPEPIQIGNNRYYAGSMVLTAASSRVPRLTLLKSYDRASAFLGHLNRVLLGLGIVAVIAGALLAFLISDTFTRPLANLVEGVRALERGDFGYPLQARGRDEVAHVTRAFDRMRNTLQKEESQRQQLEDQLRQSQKMEALGRLAGGVAHDFNNLLTVIKGHCDLLQLSVAPGGQVGDCAEQIRKAADRAVGLTRQMLAFSRRQLLQPTILNLNVLVEDMTKLVKRLIHEDIEFSFEPGASLGQVRADAGQIEQVLLNLIVNACDAMPSGGELLIETKNVSIDSGLPSSIQPGQYVVLSVTDTGFGMSPETQARMFDPFFTTKEEDKGTGLGLATVYGVISQSGGHISVTSAIGKGTRIDVYLPRIAAEFEPGPAETEGKTATTAPAHEVILLAEDEPEVRALAEQFLTSAGYHVVAAQDGLEALELADRLSVPVDLLLTDVVMPKMRGTDLARHLMPRVPNLKVVYMSGYLEPTNGDRERLEDRVLQKPFSRETLLQAIRETLRNGHLRRDRVDDGEHTREVPRTTITDPIL
jgi:two-component system, cell cycle sensor histidine kinase and response regulator CckA